MRLYAELGTMEAGPLAALALCLHAEGGLNLAGNSADERAVVSQWAAERRKPAVELSTMSGIGATKAQITVNHNHTLRKALEEAERQLAPARTEAESAQVSRQGVSVSSTSITTHNTFGVSLRDRWDGAHALAEGQASPEEEAIVLGDLQSHWDANACDQFIADAERLLARVNAAQDMVIPSAPSSASPRPNTELTEVNSSKAIRIVTNTYLRPEPMRNKLQRQLEAVPPAHRSPLSQHTTLCTLKSLWVQLKRLCEHPASTTHMRTIRAKLPNNTRDKLWRTTTQNAILTMQGRHDNTAHSPPSGRSVDTRRPPSTVPSGENLRQAEGEHHNAPPVFVVDANLTNALKYNPTTAGEKYSVIANYAGNAFGPYTEAKTARLHRVPSAGRSTTRRSASEHVAGPVQAHRDGAIHQDRDHVATGLHAEKNAITVDDPGSHQATQIGRLPLVRNAIGTERTLLAQKSNSRILSKVIQSLQSQSFIV
ncbi:unnamed protein product [Heligmosomoides polygyrus]|uniref:Reverse transcriptase domain-containing protein n=1 Tax=Heligmosomoides polygyrus TaxID=6339 RepID=A0A183FWR3_HELPZ|nr:unnamed protein product [Heligmosomoides polygyrus]